MKIEISIKRWDSNNIYAQFSYNFSIINFDISKVILEIAIMERRNSEQKKWKRIRNKRIF